MEHSKKSNKIGKIEQKNKIVRNIFLNVSKSDGGAKGKGQVMIVDHSEESQKPITNTTRDFSQVPNINSSDSRLLTPVPIICKIDLSRLTRIPGGSVYHSNHCNTHLNGLHDAQENLSRVKNLFNKSKSVFNFC